jgi:hypothetical protein
MLINMNKASEIAIKGLDVMIISGVVRIRDGNDMWLCTREAWDVAMDAVDAREPHPDDAYTYLCRKVASPVASINGTSRGDIESLVRAAYALEMIDADDGRAYGVQVQS